MATNNNYKNNSEGKKDKKPKLSPTKIAVRTLCIILALLMSGGLLTLIIDLILKLF